MTLRKISFVCAVVTLAATAPLQAQQRGSTPFADRNPQANNDARNKQSSQQLRMRKLAEEAQYEKSLRSIPEQRSTDPWAMVRAPGTSQK
jgi:hypothetical protein